MDMKTWMVPENPDLRRFNKGFALVVSKQEDKFLLQKT
jgi:hypothetical protein